MKKASGCTESLALWTRGYGARRAGRLAHGMMSAGLKASRRRGRARTGDRFPLLDEKKIQECLQRYTEMLNMEE